MRDGRQHLDRATVPVTTATCRTENQALRLVLVQWQDYLQGLGIPSKAGSCRRKPLPARDGTRRLGSRDDHAGRDSDTGNLNPGPGGMTLTELPGPSPVSETLKALIAAALLHPDCSGIGIPGPAHFT